MHNRNATTTVSQGFAANDETAPVTLPPSNDELVIAYTMIAALYRLVLRLSQGAAYDEQSRSVAESAERLLLRTDVVQRMLRLAWLERRQEFMVDQIELLEHQKQRLLASLKPIAHFVEHAHDDPDWEKQIGELLTLADLAKAKDVYRGLNAAESVLIDRQSDTSIQ